LVAAVLAGGLLATAPARAGLYNTDEKLWDWAFGPPAAYARALDSLQSVVAVETEKDPNSARAQVLSRVSDLERKLRDGSLSYEERINLSAYYVRLNDPEKAVALLEAVPPGQRDFLAWSNLATASQMAGRLERAEAYLTSALESWPKISLWTSRWRLNALKLAEKYHLQLIRSRLNEQRRAPGSAQSLDPIFPRVRFVGPSGRYEAGLLAAEQWANMPAYALEIVKILVLWMPHDARLRWLLAEMVNANNDPLGALRMMDDLSEVKRFGNPEFAEHHRVLRQYKFVVERLNLLPNDFVNERIKASLAPLGGMLSPGIEPLLDAAGTVAALDKIMQMPVPEREYKISPEPTATPPPAPSPPGEWTFDWRQTTVSFVAGVAVALLLSLQFREMRKRKQQDVAAAPKR
jgi:tetratricopeptide (TPR) repeat protein